MEPVGQQRGRIPRGSADPNDGAPPRVIAWRSLLPRARPERHRAAPPGNRADHRLVSGPAWIALALHSQSDVTRLRAAGGFTLTSCPTLHPGLTKPRRYDGEYGAAFGSSLSGTRSLAAR